MKRPALAPVMAAWIAMAAAGAGLADERSAPDRFEIGIFGGYGRTPAAGASSFLRESASTFYPRIAASDAFTFEPASAVYAGGWCTYFLTPAFGIEAGFGYLRSNARGASEFRLESFRDAAAVVMASGTGQGQMTAVPLCLNIAARLSGDGFAVRASGGLSLFLNSFLGGMTGGVEAIEPVWKSGVGDPPGQVLADEKLDALKVPLTTPDTTWTAIGANFGAGFDVRIAKRVALSVEARYFLCPAKAFAWDWTPGVYPGITGAIVSWNFTADAASAAGRMTTSLNVNPSFFQVSAGIRFSFPGPQRD
jgi:outer membrane protein W